MKKLILAQVLTTNGTAECSGLYDENGDPVTVEIEKDDNGVSLTIWNNASDKERRDCGISEEEIQRTCAMFDDCGDCPLKEYCESEGEKQN